MKRSFYVIVMLLTSLAGQAANYFTVGENDTLRILPTKVGHHIDVMVKANFDGYLDHWSLDMSYPTDMVVCDATPADGMEIPYINSLGNETIHNAVLSVGSSDHVFSSTITEFGYWDPYNNGNYQMYGTVKWPTGYYDEMFEINFRVDDDCTGEYITINATLTSTTDWRGVPTVNTIAYKSIYINVAYLRGDVDFNDVVNIQDVTALTTLLMNQGVGNLDQYQFAACDVNGDGQVTVHDGTALTNMLMNQQ